MATLPGNAMILTYGSAGERHDQHYNGVLIVAGAPLSIYVMEAKDSVTGANFNWISSSGPDFAGTGYPGPNSPTLVAITQQRVMVG